MKKGLLVASLVALLPMGILASCDKEPDPEVQVATISISGAHEVEMGESIQLDAIVTNATDYRVSWSSSNIEVATIRSDGIVQAKAVTKDTTITITAKIAGTEIVASHELTIKYVAPAPKPSIAISGASSVNMGESIKLTAEVANLNEYELEWSSSDDNVATVLNGTVTAKEVTKDEKVTITAKIKGRNDVKATYTLTVKFVDNTPAPTITVAGAKSVKMEKSITLTATVANLDEYTVIWSSSDENVATVLNGVVTAKKVTQDTNVTITASIEGHADVKFNHVVKVEYVAPAPTFNVTGGTEVKMLETLTLTPVVQHLENPVITWTSSDTNVATVADGVVTAKEVAADKTVTITAQVQGHPELKVEKVITVKYVAPQGTRVFVKGVTKNASFLKYDTNAGAQENKEEEFVELNKIRQAGDDNEMIFMPDVVFVNQDKQIIDFTGDWKFDFDIKTKDASSAYTVNVGLTSTDLIDSYDPIKCSVNFAEKAIGKDFQVTVTPQYLTEKQLSLKESDPELFKSKYVTTYEVTVVDGYNIYNADELSYFDNRTGSVGNEWNAIKKAKGLDVNIHPSSFVLQSDVKVNLQDIPASMYWDDKDTDFPTDKAEADRIRNSMRDDITVYHHELAQGEEVNFHGNYFTIDASKLPVILYDENKVTPVGGIIVSHTELFVAQSSFAETAKRGKVFVEGLKSLGNAAREENSENGGGLIYFKTTSCTATVQNCICRSYFISYFHDYTDDLPYLVKNCKGYDSYSNFIYLYGVKNATIEGSEFKGAGGPCIIADDITHKQTDHHPTNIIMKNNVVECYVSGTEGWFKGYGADKAAGQIKALNAIFAAGNRSFLKTRKGVAESDTYFNFICLHKDGSAEGMTSSSIHGSIQIDAEPAFGLGDSSNQAFVQFYETAVVASGAPGFVTSGGGIGYYNPNLEANGLINPLTNKPYAPQDYPESGLFAGDHLGLYYQGMLLTFGYYAAGQTF